MLTRPAARVVAILVFGLAVLADANARAQCDPADCGGPPNFCNVDVCDYDFCRFDPLKVAPGECGCGTPDTHTDTDGVADCIDTCPAVNNPYPARESGIDLASISRSDQVNTWQRSNVGPLPPGAQAYNLAHNFYSGVVADLDHDGRDDLVFGFGGSILSVMFGDAGGLTTPPRDTSIVGTGSGGPESLLADYLDEDGHFDFAWVGNQDNSIHVARGLGDGSFVPFATVPRPGGGAKVLASADFDLDGDIDLVAPVNWMRQFGFLANDGTGSFAPAGIFSAPASDGSSIATLKTGDFDGDGAPDIAALGWDGQVTIFLNDALVPGSFHLAPGCSPTTGCGYLTPGFSRTIGGVRCRRRWRPGHRLPGSPDFALLIGDGVGGFTRTASLPLNVLDPYITASDPCSGSGTCAKPFVGEGVLTAADFNGDGRVDIALAGSINYEAGETGPVVWRWELPSGPDRPRKLR